MIKRFTRNIVWEDGLMGRGRSRSIMGLVLLFLSAGMAASSALAETIYVKEGDTGGGTSWADAYGDLQDGLAAAVSGDEIWVAAGTYYPTNGTGRYKTFQMMNGVAIYGGFPNTGAPNFADRNPNTYITILSGDLNGDDDSSGDNSDNCYHVFYHPDGTNLDTTAILDGFTITAGIADGSGNHNKGGGMCNFSSSPRVTGCTFSGNSAGESGGGMHNNSSSPTVTGCTFSGNSASSRGGGMYNYENSSPIVANCTFSDNSAGSGGGMWNYENSNPTVTDCTFSGNSGSSRGGGMYNRDNSCPIVTGCTFSGNSGGTYGGGMYNMDSSPIVSNCIFSGNSAYWYGGGMATGGGSSTVTGCTFSGNSAECGGGMCGSGTLTNCVFTDNSAKNGGGIWGGSALTNCSFIGNRASLSGGGMYNDWESSPTVTGCTFTGNSAAYYGGGMYNYNYSNPTVTGCTFSGNSAEWQGGGMYNEISNPSIARCTFSSNSADDGGGMYNRSSDSVVVKCIFAGNSAENGGGTYNRSLYDGSSFSGCIFTGNSAESYGGGAFIYRGTIALINCTFSGNTAEGGNSLTCGFPSEPWNSSAVKIRNCIVWDGEDEIDNNDDSSISINYSCIQGGEASEPPMPPWPWPPSGNVGNIVDDPLFFNAYGADNIAGTEDDNFRLMPNSPCIDMGSNDTDPALPAKDLDGNPRIVDGTVDMGAYESPCQGFLLSRQPVPVREGQTGTFTVAMAMDPQEEVAVSVSVHSGDADITIESGGTLSFDSSNYWQEQTVTLGAADDEDSLNSETLIWISAPGFVTSGLVAVEWDDEAPTVIYVDGDAPGDNDGTSWEDAFTDLQAALGFLEVYPQIEGIHVAQGTYKPTGPDGDREATFQLVSGLAIRGGYGGFGQVDPDARDIENYETILSGDLAGDDGSGGNVWENSYHVVTGSFTNETAILDGVTITGGNASGIDCYGGGMYNDCGNPTLINCHFRGNCAGTVSTSDYYDVHCGGGGMYNTSSSPTLTNCTFTENAAFIIRICYIFGMDDSDDAIHIDYYDTSTCSGGGMYNDENSSPALTDCIFVDNLAVVSCPDNPFPLCSCTSTSYGGGMCNGTNSSPILANCTFTNNSADSGRGGGMYSYSTSNPTVTGCTFSGNSAGDGGGMFNSYLSNSTVSNCTFTGNSAIKRGGGMGNWDSSGPTVTNCIIWGNTAASSGNEIYNDTGTPIISYCDIAGCGGSGTSWDSSLGTDGGGNIDVDPMFVDADGVDDVFGTEDDDLHLAADSPCIDAGENSVVTVLTDLDGNPRIFDGDGNGTAIVDMGAYELLPAIELSMKFTPKALNVGSNGRWVKAHFVLPEGYSLDDVDTDRPGVIVELGVESDHIDVSINDEGFVEIVMSFGRGAFCGSTLDYGPAEVTVVGFLSSGQSYYGADTIKIMSHIVEALSVLASNWLETDCGKPDWCNGADVDQNSVVDLLDYGLFDGCCIEVVEGNL